MATCQSLLQQVSAEDDDLQSLEWLQNYDVRRITSFLNPAYIFKNEAVDEAPNSNSDCGRKYSHCTFSCMIFRALVESPNGVLPLPAIYRWIGERYPDMVKNGAQWKNSVRHCLSSNGRFIRVQPPAEAFVVKGFSKNAYSSWWAVRNEIRAAAGELFTEGPTHNCFARAACGQRAKNGASVRYRGGHGLTMSDDDMRAAAAILSFRKAVRTNQCKFLETKKAIIPHVRRKRQKRRPHSSSIYSAMRAVGDDHRYVSENTTLYGAQQMVKFDGTTKRVSTADAGVQVCSRDLAPTDDI